MDLADHDGEWVRVVGRYHRHVLGLASLEVPGGGRIVLGIDPRSPTELSRLHGKRVAVEGRLAMEDRPPGCDVPTLIDPTRLVVL